MGGVQRVIIGVPGSVEGYGIPGWIIGSETHNINDDDFSK